MTLDPRQRARLATFRRLLGKDMRIETLTPDHTAELIAFFRDAYAVEPPAIAAAHASTEQIAARWRWQHEGDSGSSQAGSGLNGGPARSLICLERGRIVGHVAAVRVAGRDADPDAVGAQPKGTAAGFRQHRVRPPELFCDAIDGAARRLLGVEAVRGDLGRSDGDPRRPGDADDGHRHQAQGEDQLEDGPPATVPNAPVGRSPAHMPPSRVQNFALCTSARAARFCGACHRGVVTR